MVKSKIRSAVQPFGDSTIIVANLQRAKKVNSHLLQKIAGAILDGLKIENAKIEIVLIGKREMARINRQFLQHEGSTDVITFDYQNAESRIQDPELKTTRGEIFICVDEAILQANQFQTSWQSEVVRYIIHGILHLLGHDDLKSHLRRKMKREENRLLRELSRRFALSKL